jgi:hypothetical protein
VDKGEEINTMQKLWKSKKGGIPVIGELVTIIMDVLPAPIKVGLFVILFTVIASYIIPAILSLGGYACVPESGQVELYQIPLTNTFAKFGFELNDYLKGFVWIKDYQMPEDPYPDGDKSYLRVPSECFTTQEINGTTRWGYTALCTNCSYVSNFWTYVVSLGTGKDGNTICLSDGYYQPLPNYASTGAKRICAQCNPQSPYYFNISNCQSIDDCFFTVEDPVYVPYILDTYVNTEYLQKIKSLGGVKRPQDDTQFFNIQCTSSGKPSIFMFGFEVFNKALWIVLIIGTFLVQVAWAWYGVILK